MPGRVVLAMGSDIKSLPAIGSGDSLLWGTEHGDLSDPDSAKALTSDAARLIRRQKRSPETVACDLHPGYVSARIARELAQKTGCGIELVQHHHAHIASVMYERGLKGRVLGVSFDGTGFGSDGNIWGGEFLIVDKKGFSRAAHIDYMPLPGGDMAVKEPWRMAVSIMGGKAGRFLKKIPSAEIRFITDMIGKGINTPITSSAGRLFDAAGAVMGIVLKAGFEGEGPMKIEKIADRRESKAYPFMLKRGHDGMINIDVRDIFAGMARDLDKGVSLSSLSARFHNSIAGLIVKVSRKISLDTGIKKIVLSGGVFRNKYLLGRLDSMGFRYLTNTMMPVNDLNIAAGQYFVAINRKA